MANQDQNIKSITVHFASKHELTYELGKYVLQFEVAGMFIKERLENKTGVATLQDEMRTILFIQMSNVEYIELKYKDEENVLSMDT